MNLIFFSVLHSYRSFFTFGSCIVLKNQNKQKTQNLHKKVFFYFNSYIKFLHHVEFVQQVR